MKYGLLAALPVVVAGALGVATCTDNDAPTPVPTSTSETVSTGTGFDGGVGKRCSLPGSLQYLPGGGTKLVPGAPAGTPDLSWLTLPPGYCVHYFGNVTYARQLRFAPNGDLFVASPTRCTTGGPTLCYPVNCGVDGLPACPALAGIAVLPDDDGDGFADKNITFLAGLPLTQGMLFANDHFYYQDDTKIRRVPYSSGDRKPQGPSEVVADITYYSSDTHWPKTLDVADDGTIYVGNGGDQSESCDPTRPFHGGIVQLDGSAGGKPIVKGLRNPISVRCQKGHDQCFAVELALDFSTGNGREKLLPIHAGDDWGFPCCASKNVPYAAVVPTPDCSPMAVETGAFIIGETPFAFDFEPGKWPAPYAGSVFVPLHGVAGSWRGARVVVLATDPKTGAPLPGSDLNGVSSGSLSDFALGWDDNVRDHGRPATIAFAPDGRMFIGNDNDGSIIWIAPLGLN